jgi:hypothetical protein
LSTRISVHGDPGSLADVPRNHVPRGSLDHRFNEAFVVTRRQHEGLGVASKTLVDISRDLHPVGAVRATALAENLHRSVSLPLELEAGVRLHDPLVDVAVAVLVVRVPLDVGYASVFSHCPKMRVELPIPLNN